MQAIFILDDLLTYWNVHIFNQFQKIFNEVKFNIPNYSNSEAWLLLIDYYIE